MIQFSEEEADILFTIPSSPCNLRGIIKAYVFTNRAAVPGCDVLSKFLQKSLDVGIIRLIAAKNDRNGISRYQVTPEWYSKIHSSCESNEMEAEIEFSDEFSSLQFEAKQQSGFVLPTPEYEEAINRSFFEA